MVQAIKSGAVYRLPHNPLWNIPAGDEVRFDIQTFGPWYIIRSIKGLAIDEHGTIYGIRTMTDCHESGYAQEGRVSIGGKKRRAFTSSQLFQREDGSLCNVAILYVCKQKLPWVKPGASEVVVTLRHPRSKK